MFRLEGGHGFVTVSIDGSLDDVSRGYVVLRMIYPNAVWSVIHGPYVLYDHAGGDPADDVRMLSRPIPAIST